MKNYTLHNRIAILLMAITDISFVVLADLSALLFRFSGSFPDLNFHAYRQLSPYIIFLRITAFYIFHLYNRPRYKSNIEIFINTLKACTFSSCIIIFSVYFLDIIAYPRSVAFLSWLLTIMYVGAWRFILKEFIGMHFGRDFFRVNLLIIGTGYQAREVSDYMLRSATTEYNLVGFIRTREDSAITVDGNQVAGLLKDIDSIISKQKIDEVIVADPSLTEAEIADFMARFDRNKIVVRAAPAAYGTMISGMVVAKSEGIFLGSTILRTEPSAWYANLKRVIDIALSVSLLALTAPILAISAVLIRTTSEGGILYTQERVGKDGKRFVIYKLRTMYISSEKDGQPRWAAAGDARVTPVGKFLRRWRIDELPQFVNILKNEMSVVGPRPERPYFNDDFVRKIPFYAERLRIKPGLTGWAQVNFKYAATEEETRRKLLYDLFYIQNRSFSLDLLIALKTLKVIITGNGSN